MALHFIVSLASIVLHLQVNIDLTIGPKFVSYEYIYTNVADKCPELVISGALAHCPAVCAGLR